MNHNPTVLEISAKAVTDNLNYFRSILNEETLMLAVVKASAYGTDPIQMARLLEENGVNYFAVAYADEGIALRKAGIALPILVLHPQFDNLELLVEYRLEPNIYSHKVLREFLRISKVLQLEDYPVHVKFNTGLNRLGFEREDLERIYSVLGREKSIFVKSLFSHLVASEDESARAFTMKQIDLFKQITERFERLWGYRPIRHMTNTSGILNYPGAHFDMVRVGLGLFGLANDDVLDSKLSYALTLKSVISQIHRVKKGQNVGYNMGFTAREDGRTATIPIGHADGIFRSLGKGRISVGVQSSKAPVIGNICMDMIMIDVTGIDCSEGDEVILFESREELLQMARQANTISYELLTALGPRIKRVFVS
jgi:alanine racemase